MNLKKAKALRKFLRTTGINFKDSRYQVRVTKRILRVDPETGAKFPEDRLQMRLHPESGRAVYRRLKALWA